MIVAVVEEEYDDICQRLRIKAWRAVSAFEGKRDVNSVGVDRFVFACLQNEVKDLKKKVRRNECFIEDLAPSGQAGYDLQHVLARDQFEGHYFQVTQEQAFKEVEEEIPLIPSTLSEAEKEIIYLLYLDFDYGEISVALTIPRKEVAPRVRVIREKMRDWKPGVGPVGDGTVVPLTTVEATAAA